MPQEISPDHPDWETEIAKAIATGKSQVETCGGLMIAPAPEAVETMCEIAQRSAEKRGSKAHTP